MMRWLPRLAPIAAALLLSGCYFDRLTGKYDELPELETSSALLETSSPTEKTEEEIVKQLETLEKIAEEAYAINAGDTIEINVYSHPDLSVKRTIVTPDGHVGMLFVGQVKVAGLSLEQAAKSIEEKLSKYIRNPKVGISPVEIRSETVTIAGAVSKPGMYTIANGMRLADLLAQAGGAATRMFDGQSLDASDLAKSVFIRHNKVVPLDFHTAIYAGKAPHNLLLHKGDYIYIAPREESTVYLVGDVKKPSRFMWSRNLGLVELLANAGWVNETHWSHAIIIRGGLSRPKMYKVDLDGILAGKKSNVPLQAGDIVYMPHDNFTEYNVFVRKLFPTGQLLNLLTTPMTWHTNLGL